MSDRPHNVLLPLGLPTQKSLRAAHAALGSYLLEAEKLRVVA